MRCGGTGAVLVWQRAGSCLRRQPQKAGRCTVIAVAANGLEQQLQDKRCDRHAASCGRGGWGREYTMLDSCTCSVETATAGSRLQQYLLQLHPVKHLLPVLYMVLVQASFQLLQDARWAPVSWYTLGVHTSIEAM